MRRSVTTITVSILAILGLLTLPLAHSARAVAVTFGDPVSYEGGFNGTMPASAQADLNGDGYLDIILTQGKNEYLSIWYGTADGTFVDNRLQTTPRVINDVIPSDINNDGAIDLLLFGYGARGGWSIVNDGLGNFGEPTWFAVVGGATVFIGNAAADINGDGNVDVAVALDNDGAAVLLGDGSGAFSAPAPVMAGMPAGVAPRDIALADINGDGQVDVLTANRTTIPGYALSISYGDGSGNFGTAQPINGGLTTASRLATSDSNGDGMIDLVLLNDSGARLLVNTNGSLSPVGQVNGLTVASDLAVADLNNDNLKDVVITSQAGINAYTTDQAGNLSRAYETAKPFSFTPLVSDYNRDGTADLAILDKNDTDPITFHELLIYFGGQRPTNTAPYDAFFNTDSTLLNVGQTVASSGYFRDNDSGDTHTANFNLGDGTTSPGAVSAGTPPYLNVTGSYAYANEGEFQTSLTITDDRGLSVETAPRTITVVNPNTTHSFLANGSFTADAGDYMINGGHDDTGPVSINLNYHTLGGQTSALRPLRVSFPAGGMTFVANSTRSMAVNGDTVYLRGSGLWNNQATLTYFVTADRSDKTMRVQLKSGLQVIFDSQPEEADNAPASSSFSRLLLVN